MVMISKLGKNSWVLIHLYNQSSRVVLKKKYNPDLFEICKEHKKHFGVFFRTPGCYLKAISTKNFHSLEGCYSTFVCVFVLSGQLLNLLTLVVMKMITHWIGE